MEYTRIESVSEIGQVNSNLNDDKGNYGCDQIRHVLDHLIDSALQCQEKIYRQKLTCIKDIIAIFKAAWHEQELNLTQTCIEFIDELYKAMMTKPIKKVELIKPFTDKILQVPTRKNTNPFLVVKKSRKNRQVDFAAKLAKQKVKEHK